MWVGDKIRDIEITSVNRHIPTDVFRRHIGRDEALDIRDECRLQQHTITIEFISPPFEGLLKNIVRQPMNFDGHFIGTIIHTIIPSYDNRDERIFFQHYIRGNFPNYRISSGIALSIFKSWVVIVFPIFFTPNLIISIAPEVPTALRFCSTQR